MDGKGELILAEKTRKVGEFKQALPQRLTGGNFINISAQGIQGEAVGFA